MHSNPLESSPKMTDSQNSINDYMTGFARRNPEGLNHLANYPRWQQVAEQEQERRATRFVASLTDEDLAAIASGEADINTLAKAMQAK